MTSAKPKQNTQKKPDTLKQYRQWKLLLIRADGRTAFVGRLKEISLAIIVLFALVLVLGGAGFILYKGALADRVTAEKALSAAKMEATSLRKEKDRLLVRLVMLESQKHEAQAEEKGLEPKEVFESLPLQETAPALASAEPQKSTEPAQPPEAKTENTVAAETPKPRQVAIEDFTADLDAKQGELKIKFKIVKTDTRMRHVSGYLFVILKPQDAPPSEWISLPGVELTDGLPSQIKRGDSFQISRFKNVRFKKKMEHEPMRYQQAQVLVFDDNEKILLDQEFALKG